MANKMDIEKKKVVTPEFRVSFPNVFTAKAFEGQEPKYNIQMLFDQNQDLAKMKRAARNAKIEKWGKDKAAWPKRLKSPFRDGDEKSDLEGYAGKIFVSATSKIKPGLVDASVEPIMSEEDFYAGCYARAELIAYAFDVSGNRGIAFSLQNIQKTRDGESFSNRKKAEDVFDAVDEPEDDDVEDDEDDDDIGF